MSACKSPSRENETNENQSQNPAFPNSCHYKFPATAPVTLAVKHNEEGNMLPSQAVAWHDIIAIIFIMVPLFLGKM